MTHILVQRTAGRCSVNIGLDSYQQSRQRGWRACGTWTCAIYLHNIYIISTQYLLHIYTGVRCDSSCERGWWGRGCGEQCQCEHGSCEPATGTCSCDRGYSGPRCVDITSDDPPLHIVMSLYRCDIPCSPGFYGVNCRQACPPCNASKS